MRSNYLVNLILFSIFAVTSATASAATFAVDSAGKTVLFFDEGHGNQVEFYSPDGRAFLWYPGNAKAVPGRWMINGEDICFLYGRQYLNPVSGKWGGEWNCSNIARWSERFVDTIAGDAFGLSGPALPFRLPAKPKYESMTGIKAQVDAIQK